MTPDVVRRPGPAERDPVGHRRRRRVVDLSLGIGVPVALITLWQVASSQGWIDARLFPSPSTVVSQGRRLWADGKVWPHVWVSTKRIAAGYLLGASAGVLLGLAMGVNRVVRAALEPLLNALYTVPKLAVLPVYLVIFGYREAPIIALIATTVFFFVWISTLAAVVAVPEGYREAGRSIGVRGAGAFRHILLPAALPQIVVGLRIAAGVTVLMLVGVEFVVADEGLGFMIEQGRSLLLLSQTYVGIALASVLGLLFVYIIQFVGWLATPWARSERS